MKGAERIVGTTERRLARLENSQGAMTPRLSASDRATLAGVTDEASRILDAALQLPQHERAQSLRDPSRLEQACLRLLLSPSFEDAQQ